MASVSADPDGIRSGSRRAEGCGCTGDADGGCGGCVVKALGAAGDGTAAGDGGTAAGDDGTAAGGGGSVGAAGGG